MVGTVLCSKDLALIKTDTIFLVEFTLLLGVEGSKQCIVIHSISDDDMYCVKISQLINQPASHLGKGISTYAWGCSFKKYVQEMASVSM